MSPIDKEQINLILDEHSKKKSFNSVKWTVNENNETYYYFSLFSSYRAEKLSAYKKIFDYCNQKGIDLFQSFHDACFVNNPKVAIHRYPEFLDLINYVVQKKYFNDSIDFSKFFNIYSKTTKSNFNSQFKLLDVLDLSEKSLKIYLNLFKNAVSYLGKFDNEFQSKIKKKFDLFQNESFYSNYLTKIQEYYPNLLEVSDTNFQEDNYLSKRFCLDFSNPVNSLQEKLKNNLEYIYGSVFSERKDRDLISDFYSFSEQNCFYLYIFSDNQQILNQTSKALQQFHNEISEFLKDNSQTQDYYSKLFDAIYLDSKLTSNLKNGSSSKPLKI